MDSAFDSLCEELLASDFDSLLDSLFDSLAVSLFDADVLEAELEACSELLLDVLWEELLLKLLLELLLEEALLELEGSLDVGFSSCELLDVLPEEAPDEEELEELELDVLEELLDSPLTVSVRVLLFTEQSLYVTTA